MEGGIQVNFMQRISARLFRPWQAATKQDLKTTEENIMATLKEQLDAIEASQNAQAEKLAEAIGELTIAISDQAAEIATLKEQVANGSISAEAQATLDRITASSAENLNRANTLANIIATPTVTEG